MKRKIPSLVLFLTRKPPSKILNTKKKFFFEQHIDSEFLDPRLDEEIL